MVKFLNIGSGFMGLSLVWAGKGFAVRRMQSKQIAKCNIKANRLASNRITNSGFSREMGMSAAIYKSLFIFH
jgi:hypothetical protein